MPCGIGEAMDLDKQWGVVLGLLKGQLSGEMYDRWFSATSLAEDTGTALVVEIPNPIHEFWIESNFSHVLQTAVVEALGSPRAISFRVRGLGRLQEEEVEGRELVASGRAKAPASSAAVVVAPPNGVGGRMSAPEAKWQGKTFEAFVVGKNNQYASGAAMAVARRPGEIYNPLFIHGGPGLGKTHLLKAIGNLILEQNRKAKVIYVTSEDFMNAFIEALRAGEMSKFRARFRRADVLLIDDIHFLGGKKASTQEEFFHTFNELFDAHKQIVLTSDRPPSEIEQLERRLVSRCEWGLMAELQVPDVEMRTAILRNKMKEMGAEIPEELVEFLAVNVRSNVRRLEGGLMRLASFQSLAHEPGELTVEVAEELLKDILGEEKGKTVSISVIQKTVAEYFDVRVAELVGPRRPRNIARPRQIAMYLARENSGLPLQAIAEAFNRKDHGTVIHACVTVGKLAKGDAEFRKMLDQIRLKCGAVG